MYVIAKYLKNVGIKAGRMKMKPIWLSFFSNRISPTDSRNWKSVSAQRDLPVWCRQPIEIYVTFCLCNQSLRYVILRTTTCPYSTVKPILDTAFKLSMRNPQKLTLSGFGRLTSFW